jgi:UDP-glucose 4-epimerase
VRILLTGANGFIGSYFHRKYENKYDIQAFSFVNDVFENLSLENINVVVHLSALVHQMKGASDESYFHVNVGNTLALATKAKEMGVRHFVFMSSVKVYGEESDVIYKENTICMPQDSYGKSKLEAENKLKDLEDSFFKVSIVRTPIVYGYGVKANIANLMKLVKKVPILPFGGISNRRTMVYIGNLCDIIHIIIQKEKSGIFLAADDNAISTSELIKLIALSLKKSIWLLSIPFFPLLIKRLEPSIYKRLYQNLEIDNTYTKNILEFSNSYSIEEGMYFMINKEF